MKAVIYSRENRTDQLIEVDIEKPIPKDNEVVVKVYAVSLNAADYRSMKMGIIPKRKIFGSDIAGRVESVGKDIKKFSVGDEVLGDLSSYGFGGLAEYAVAPETKLILKPEGLSYDVAAAIPMATLTALQALRNIGNIQSGQRVLICGAGGGVGTFAVQLAKTFGAHVTAVCGEHNVERILALGADQVIDYNVEDFTQSNLRYDLVLGINGNHTLSAYKHILAKNGIFVLVGSGLNQVVKTLGFGPFMSIGSKKLRFLAAKASVEDLKLIVQLVLEGKVKPVIDRHYPLYETAEAMRYLSNGHAQGKVIIEVVEGIGKQ